ncbi:hypothetical protein FACS189441_3190 [Betaproteobacteria bacterium]|nr:hypothetical protein FACS189441_3190 [Betaproteobacteria bacterium]
MGLCLPIKTGDDVGVVPAQTVSDYFAKREDQIKLLSGLNAERSVKLVKSTKHGVLTKEHYRENVETWVYMPKEGYLGNDQAEFLVEMEGVLVRLVYIFRVTNLSTDSETGDSIGVCKKSQWIISQFSPEDYNTPDLWYRSTSMYALLTGAKQA